MIIAFGDFEPDNPDYNAARSVTVTNVVPIKGGYGPFGALVNFTAALPAPCRGYFYARKADGSITIFAATATRLYQLNNTDFTWTDVSKGGAAYASVPSGDQWQFAQFNNFVFAVQINTAPQVFDLSSSPSFSDLAGSPPQARYIAIVNRFVVLSGLSGNFTRIQWSGLNATTTWTSGVSSSDFQDLPDGGFVRGVAGGEYGLITQDAALRRMIFAPGSPYTFQIERVSEEKGILAPLSLTRSGDRVFFIGSDGFKMVAPGSYPVPIGKERIDRFFAADVDTANLQFCIGASDPKQSRVFFAYKSLSGQAGLFDKILCYDWALDKFSLIITSGEYLSSLAKPGLTLENLDAIAGSLDALAFSLDDVSTAALSQLSCIDAGHRVGFFSGAPLEATLDTSDQALDGHQRVRVRGLRPITDAALCYGSVSVRGNLQNAPVYSAEIGLDAHGYVAANVATRSARARLRIPAGTTWTYAQGIEPDFIAEGTR
jgi:hypothetical protein